MLEIFQRFKNMRWLKGAGIGAAFLMANSSIGPGFLTQTTFFTKELLTSFGFVILISVVLDLGAQLNTWRILTMSEMRAQDLANALLPGLGFFISALVVLGGFAFNIGNIAGCGLGINVLTGLSFETGAVISCGVALILFWSREIGGMLDVFTKTLGIVKISLAIFIAFAAAPPMKDAVLHTFVPEKFSLVAIITIVGGTVGGYLTFSGAHRLLDAGIRGREHMKVVDQSAVKGILISSIMRFILFLAVVGVAVQGVVFDQQNLPATVFRTAAGEIGYRIFGIILWSAAISSVVGAAYTSISFFKTFHPSIQKNERWWISAFIVLSTLIFVWIGKPMDLLLLAGGLNGLILPVALSIILIAARNERLMKGYRHNIWMQLFGWIVVAIMGWMSIQAVMDWKS
jgi:Mn2+/Fe2+ NRAMP family transporter